MTPPPSLPRVGPRLNAARLRRGLSQGTVARRAGIAPSYLSRIENERIQPTFPTVVRIVRALHAEFDEIIGPEPPDDDRRGVCPVSESGICLLELIRTEQQAAHTGRGETYTPRQTRLLRLVADWVRHADTDRLKALEILIEDLRRGAKG